MKNIAYEESSAEAQAQLKEPKEKIESSAFSLVDITLHQLFITFAQLNNIQLTYKSPNSVFRSSRRLWFSDG